MSQPFQVLLLEVLELVFWRTFCFRATWTLPGNHIALLEILPSGIPGGNQEIVFWHKAGLCFKQIIFLTQQTL